MALATAAPSPPRPTLDGADVCLRAQGITHVYPARDGLIRALEEVDLDARRGELLALLGPSGCGKSTLLRILSGLLRPTRGTVALDGQPPPAAYPGAGVGWLAQDDGLLPWRTVADNVALACRLGGRAPTATQVHADVASLLERVGLADSARRYPHELSGGMRQRAALARALVAGPRFLFLDEPFASLDEITRERLGDLLLALHAAARPTTLLVTHSTVEAVRLADRVVVLSPRPGRALADLPIHLPRPRRYDQPSFGARVERLKLALAEGERRSAGERQER